MVSEPAPRHGQGRGVLVTVAARQGVMWPACHWLELWSLSTRSPEVGCALPAVHLSLPGRLLWWWKPRAPPL